MISSVQLIIHIGFGTIAILGGTIALSSSKGSTIHKLSGKVFAITMGLAAIFGSFIAFNKPELVTVISGILTTYLIITSWASNAKKRFQGSFLLATALIAFAIGGWSFVGGMEALKNLERLKHGFPPEPYFVFSGLAVFSGTMDLNFFLRNKSCKKHKLTRHIWRMCTAMLIAASALLLGQMQVFPSAIRTEAILSIPLILILAIMVFYLLRTYFQSKHGFKT